MTLPPPPDALEACVVVPARDEEALVGACIAALAAQRDVERDAVEVILVLDRCTDATATRAREAALAGGVRLHVVDAPADGVGHARRHGMDLACARLFAAGRPHGLIATTDADSEPDPDWLRMQLDAVAAGARAIGGRVELGAAERAALPPAVVARRGAEARARLARVRADAPAGVPAEHHQFSGASLALTAATYAAIGGLEPREALEDEGLERLLRRHGVAVHRLGAVRVTTSGRLGGRARRGLAVDLRRSWWQAERTYAAWVRTGLFALASGIGAHTLLNGVVPGWLAMADASMLIAFSIFCFGAAIWRHLNPGPPPPVPQLAPIPRPVLITVNVFLALVSLAALIGIWFGLPIGAVAQIPPR